MSSKYDYQTRIKKKNFSQEMMETGAVPNLTAAVIIILYTFLFSGLPYESIKLWQVFCIIGYAAIVFVALETIIAPKTNYYITHIASDDLEKNANNELSETERTKLVRLLNEIPLKIMIEVGVCFLLASFSFMLLIIILLKLDIYKVIFLFMIALYGSYEAGVLAFTYAERLCSTKTVSVASKSLNDEILSVDKFYGIGTLKKLVLCAVVPFILGCLVQFIYFLMKYIQYGSFSSVGVIEKVTYGVLILINIGLTLIPLYFMKKRNSEHIDAINTNLESLLDGKFENTEDFISDFCDELSYNYYLVGRNVNILKKIVNVAQQHSSEIRKSTNILYTTSSNTLNESINQSNAIEECVEVMNKKQESLVEAAQNVLSVEKAAEVTLKSIVEDVQLVQDNTNQLLDISQANIETIIGIKKLSEQIETVWKIIETIERLAQKTRIIAFNAELEATASGEIGQNFHIVANEIRRLVSQILNSVTEIREGITEIQHFSDNLIISSEGGTEKIREGSQQFSELEEKIAELKVSGEVTTESVADIKKITQVQSSQILQIVSTLQSVSSHFEELKKIASGIQTTSEKLEEIASGFVQIEEKEASL